MRRSAKPDLAPSPQPPGFGRDLPRREGRGKRLEGSQGGRLFERLWLELAEARERTHPAESIAIYRSHVGRVLQDRGNNVYAEAVGYLEKIRKLLIASDRGAAFGDLVTEIRNTHKHKRKLMKMLDR